MLFLYDTIEIIGIITIIVKHYNLIYLFIYLVTFNTVHVISRRVIGRAEETSTYNWSRFCTVNCRPTASNYQLSHLRPCREPNPGLRGGKRECYHSATVAPHYNLITCLCYLFCILYHTLVVTDRKFCLISTCHHQYTMTQILTKFYWITVIYVVRYSFHHTINLF